MKILMIVSNSYIHDARVVSEAISLANNRHDVKVIAWDRLNQYSDREWFTGVNVIRIQNKGFLRVLPGVLMKNPLWWRKAFKHGLKLFYDEWKFDVVHCHDLDTLPAGVWLKKKTNCHLVYDAHEIFGYMISNKTQLLSKIIFWMEKKLIKHVDKIITVNKPLKEYFHTISLRPIEIIMNCKKTQSTDYHSPENDVFTIIYLGALNENRFLLESIDVIKEIKDVKLIIGGQGKLSNEIKNKCSTIKNIDFIGLVKQDKVIQLTKKSDVVLCILNPNNKNNQVGLPNKVFEAMVCGRPIIITKDLYYENVVNDGGIAIEFSKKSLKNAIIHLRDNPKFCEQLGKNALKKSIDDYNWKTQEQKLLELYT